MIRWIASGAAALIVAAAAATLPHSTLSVRSHGAWRVWWRSEQAPSEWRRPDPLLTSGIVWHPSAAGVEWTEVTLAGSGEAWRTRLVAARLDPRRLRFRLDTAFDENGDAAWRVERASRNAVFAVNAGQFVHALPWGWVLLDGHEMLAAAHGPLATTIAVDSAGGVSFAVGDAATDSLRRDSSPRWAFQSYPALLVHGVVPAPLRAEGNGVDLGHRDARAAIGLLGDGRLIVAITRFDALSGALAFVPFGLTTPEMAAVMGALGARDAVMLDGGISAQLMVRGPRGTLRSWAGVRAVPLALVASPR